MRSVLTKDSVSQIIAAKSVKKNFALKVQGSAQVVTGLVDWKS